MHLWLFLSLTSILFPLSVSLLGVGAAALRLQAAHFGFILVNRGKKKKTRSEVKESWSRTVKCGCKRWWQPHMADQRPRIVSPLKWAVLQAGGSNENHDALHQSARLMTLQQNEVCLLEEETLHVLKNTKKWLINMIMTKLLSWRFYPL